MEEKIATIEELAGMIQRTMASKEDVAGLRKEMKDSFSNVNARLDFIREEIAGLLALRQEVYDLRERVKRLEERSGLTK